MNVRDMMAVGFSKGDKLTATASIEEVDGAPRLNIDVGDKGVSIGLPADMGIIDAACDILIGQLAGITKANLVIAAITAMANLDSKADAANMASVR